MGEGGSQTEEIEIEEEDSQYNELESVPDVLQSGSGSYSKELDEKFADAMAKELLQAMVEGYKQDNQFELENPQKTIDEDLFEDKFPYTLDKKPVKSPPKASPIKKPEDAKGEVKKVKTEREAADEAYRK